MRSLLPTYTANAAAPAGKESRPDRKPLPKKKLNEKTKEQTNELAKEASSTSEKASNELSEASDKQNTASNELASGEPSSAAPDQSAALNDLNEAKAALEKQASELAEALGQESINDPSALSEAAAAIAEAQASVSEAQEQLAAAESAANELAERQKILAEAVGEASTNSPVDPALAKAAIATEIAAKELSYGDLKGALEQMENAQNALSEAQDPSGEGQGEGQGTPSEFQDEQRAIQELTEQLANAGVSAASAPLGQASDAAIAMELGCDGVLVNTCLLYASPSPRDRG